MVITVADTTPRVWLGCLSCYANGRLVGDWYDAIEADGADRLSQMMLDIAYGHRAGIKADNHLIQPT